MSNDLYKLFVGAMDHEKDREDTYVSSVFGWPGGKDMSKKRIIPELPYRDSFIETCGGQGVIGLNRQPGMDNLHVFNDRDSGVTAFFRCFRDWDTTKALVHRIETFIHSKEMFIWCKETWKNHTDPVERAARWYYIVRYSFSQKKVCFARATEGRYRNPLMGFLTSKLSLFPMIYERVTKWQVDNLDMFQCLEDYNKPGAVFYLDPNYYGVAKGTYEHEIPDAKHHTLVERIMRGKGFYALSGYPNPVYDDPSLKWTRRIQWEVPVKMKAQAFTEGNNKVGHENQDRGVATEVLWIKDHHG